MKTLTQARIAFAAALLAAPLAHAQAPSLPAGPPVIETVGAADAVTVHRTVVLADWRPRWATILSVCVRARPDRRSRCRAGSPFFS